MQTHLLGPPILIQSGRGSPKIRWERRAGKGRSRGLGREDVSFPWSITEVEMMGMGKGAEIKMKKLELERTVNSYSLVYNISVRSYCPQLIKQHLVPSI